MQPADSVTPGQWDQIIKLNYRAVAHAYSQRFVQHPYVGMTVGIDSLAAYAERRVNLQGASLYARSKIHTEVDERGEVVAVA